MPNAKRLHRLHGWVKRFWLFMLITAVLAFAANSGAQLIFQGEVDIYRAASMSVTLGIVLAIFMSRRGRLSGRR